MKDWPESVTVNDMVLLRRLGRESAESWLDENRPEIQGTDRKRVLDALPKHRVITVQPYVPTRYDPYARFFCCAAWLAGASMRQLGRSFGIRPSTVSDKINGVMDVVTRNGLRLQNSLSDEDLEEMREWFYDKVAKDPLSLRDKPIIVVTENMLQHVKYKRSEEDGD